MNIFVLDTNPRKAAEYHNDKHTIKMILETAQLLSTAHHTLDGSAPESAYKPTHKNHPSAIWARETISNYQWLLELGFALCAEYTTRYGKTHKTQGVLEALRIAPANIPAGDLTPFALAMPDQYRTSDAVESYRAYYQGDKASISTWRTQAPHWWRPGVIISQEVVQ